MTGGQCRMARAALGWSAQELATKAGVGLDTVIYERKFDILAKIGEDL